MIKIDKKMTEVSERHKFCDVCGVEIEMDYLACSKAQCGYCKKDLCEDCIGHEESSLGDYRGEIWCRKCWEIGNEYRPQIEKLNDKIEQLYDEWRNKCEGGK